MATDQIGPILSAAVYAAADALYPRPTRILLQPGAEVAWDECCGGQLWGRVVRVSGRTKPGSGFNACAILFWEVVLAVGVIRCVAVSAEDGTAPSDEAITADAWQFLSDLAAIQEALACRVDLAGVGDFTPLGPQGGCAGGEWQFTVRVPVCACP